MSIDSYNASHMDFKIQAAIMDADKRELILLSNKKSILLEKWRMGATPLHSTSHTISYALRAIKTCDVFMRD